MTLKTIVQTENSQSIVSYIYTKHFGEQLPMEIYILRHAKAARDSKDGSDFERPLNEKGKKQLNLLAEFLRKHPISPEIIMVSSSKRTRQTVKGISEFILDPVFINDLYLADKDALLDQFSQVGKVNSILLVGHNEGLSDLVSYLTHTSIHLPTCGFVKLETTLDDASLLSAGVASLVWEFYPEVT